MTALMATQPATTVADVLDKAADLIAAPGAWTQGRFHTVIGGVDCYCAMGAIDQVSICDTQAQAARMAMLEAIGRFSVTSWNDAPYRTQSEVVAKLREAAAKARAEKVA